MKIDYTHLVTHQSSREGARVHLLVLHTTEGSDNPHGVPPSDLVALGSLFDRKEASSHFGINVNGQVARYVADDRKAWTQCNFNPVSLSAEQVAFAATSRGGWFRDRHPQLHVAAEFLLYGHRHHGVPLRHGRVSGGGVTIDGVVEHRDLGLIGCGHSDCGAGYPLGYVILLAQLFEARDRGAAGDADYRRLRRKTDRLYQRGVKAA